MPYQFWILKTAYSFFKFGHTVTQKADKKQSTSVKSKKLKAKTIVMTDKGLKGHGHTDNCVEHKQVIIPILPCSSRNRKILYSSPSGGNSRLVKIFSLFLKNIHNDCILEQ